MEHRQVASGTPSPVGVDGDPESPTYTSARDLRDASRQRKLTEMGFAFRGDDFEDNGDADLIPEDAEDFIRDLDESIDLCADTAIPSFEEDFGAFISSLNVDFDKVVESESPDKEFPEPPRAPYTMESLKEAGPYLAEISQQEFRDILAEGAFNDEDSAALKRLRRKHKNRISAKKSARMKVRVTSEMADTVRRLRIALKRSQDEVDALRAIIAEKDRQLKSVTVHNGSASL